MLARTFPRHPVDETEVSRVSRVNAAFQMSSECRSNQRFFNCLRHGGELHSLSANLFWFRRLHPAPPDESRQYETQSPRCGNPGKAQSLEHFCRGASTTPDVPAVHAYLAHAAVPNVNGPELNLTSGVAFTGEVGFYSSPVLDPPLKYAATIHWGDGATSTATLSYGKSGSDYGYIISGSHTYATGGVFNVKVLLDTTPVNPSMGLPTRLIEVINDKAIVDSSNGNTVTELVGHKFSATLGTFSFPAPAQGLSATISWGDGKSSYATIAPTGVCGIDVINFKLTGTHTYSKTGIYAVRVVVRKLAPAGHLSSPRFTARHG